MSSVQRVARLAAILVLTLTAMWLLSNTSAAATAPLASCSPVPTPETMAVEPVSSPTTLLAQTLQVRLGNGRLVTVSSEAGATVFNRTFSAAFLSPLPVPLLPNVTHHVIVAGQVEYRAGCYYVLSRAVDKNGAPLTIVQLGRRTFLPILFKH